MTTTRTTKDIVIETLALLRSYVTNEQPVKAWVFDKAEIVSSNLSSNALPQVNELIKFADHISRETIPEIDSALREVVTSIKNAIAILHDLPKIAPTRVYYRTEEVGKIEANLSELAKTDNAFHNIFCIWRFNLMPAKDRMFGHTIQDFQTIEAFLVKAADAEED